MYNYEFQDYELCKILKPSYEELSEFVKGNNDNYNYRIEARLSCNICYAYTYLDDLNGYTSQCRLFKCYYYYHGDCVGQWKQFKLIRNNGTDKKSNFFSMKVVLEKCMITYILMNGKLIDKELKYP